MVGQVTMTFNSVIIDRDVQLAYIEVQSVKYTENCMIRNTSLYGHSPTCFRPYIYAFLFPCNTHCFMSVYPYLS